MRRLLSLLLMTVVGGGGGWFFFQHYRLEGLEGVRVVPQDSTAPLPWLPQVTGVGGGPSGAMRQAELPVQRSGDTIRIGSFNIQVFGNNKLGKPEVVDILARIVRRFDVVAIQEIRARDQDLIPQFVELINQAGRNYDYVLGDRQGRTNSKEQYAFIFDRASVEVDRLQVYSIDDPDDLLHRPPLVAMFRVRGPPASEAFTFTLINVHTDPDEVAQELEVLDDVYRIVQNDGRNEDDVVMLGDFNASDRELAGLGQARLAALIEGIPTNTRGTAQYDNILISEAATVEFTGRAGVLDFIREHNLSLEQALEVSDHLPVWAEFRLEEAGAAGHVAQRP